MKVDHRFKLLPPEAVTLLSRGSLIDALKLLRKSHDLNLKQAMDWIDSHVAGDPVLRVQFQEKRRADRRQAYSWFVGVAVVASGAIYFFFSG